MRDQFCYLKRFVHPDWYFSKTHEDFHYHVTSRGGVQKHNRSKKREFPHQYRLSFALLLFESVQTIDRILARGNFDGFFVCL